ncbi:FliO/MopB family protein, partial [bacterium]|nr:FliO/MopB family protein [bacterium]
MDIINLELILKMCIALGAVLLVFGGSVFLFRKFGTRFGLGMKGGARKKRASDISVESFYNLGPGRSVYVVKVDSKRVLLGSTQNSISFLTDLEQDLDVSVESGFSNSLKQSVDG